MLKAQVRRLADENNWLRKELNETQQQLQDVEVELATLKEEKEYKQFLHNTLNKVRTTGLGNLISLIVQQQENAGSDDGKSSSRDSSAEIFAEEEEPGMRVFMYICLYGFVDCRRPCTRYVYMTEIVTHTLARTYAHTHTHTYKQTCIHTCKLFYCLGKAPQILQQTAKPADEGKQPPQQPAEFEVSDRLQVLHNLIQQYIHQVTLDILACVFVSRSRQLALNF